MSEREEGEEPDVPPTRVFDWSEIGLVPWLVVLQYRLRVRRQARPLVAKLVLKWQFSFVFDVDLLFNTIAEWCADDFDSILKLAEALDGMCRAWVVFAEPLPSGATLHYTPDGVVYHGVDLNMGGASMELQGFKVNYFYRRVAEWLRERYARRTWVSTHPGIREATWWKDDKAFMSLVFRSQCFCVDCFKYLPLHHHLKPLSPGGLSASSKFCKSRAEGEIKVHVDKLTNSDGSLHSEKGYARWLHLQRQALFRGAPDWQPNKTRQTPYGLPYWSFTDYSDLCGRDACGGRAAAARCFECLNDRYPMVGLADAWGVIAQVLQRRCIDPQGGPASLMRRCAELTADRVRIGGEERIFRNLSQPPESFERMPRAEGLNALEHLRESEHHVFNPLQDKVSVAERCMTTLYYTPKSFGPTSSLSFSVQPETHDLDVSPGMLVNRLGLSGSTASDMLWDRICGHGSTSFWFMRLLTYLPYKRMVVPDLYWYSATPYQRSCTFTTTFVDPLARFSWFRTAFADAEPNLPEHEGRELLIRIHEGVTVSDLTSCTRCNCARCLRAVSTLGGLGTPFASELYKHVYSNTHNPWSWRKLPMFLLCDVELVANLFADFLEPSQENTLMDVHVLEGRIMQELHGLWMKGKERVVPNYVDLLVPGYEGAFLMQQLDDDGGAWPYGDDLRHRLWWGCAGQHDSSSLLPFCPTPTVWTGRNVYVPVGDALRAYGQTADYDDATLEKVLTRSATLRNSHAERLRLGGVRWALFTRVDPCYREFGLGVAQSERSVVLFNEDAIQASAKGKEKKDEPSTAADSASVELMNALLRQDPGLRQGDIIDLTDLAGEFYSETVEIRGKLVDPPPSILRTPSSSATPKAKKSRKRKERQSRVDRALKEARKGEDGAGWLKKRTKRK